METRANYLIVGLFTLAVIAAGFVFVWWFQRPVLRTPGNSFEVVFDGSVSGLRAGSSVLFNGIRVGEVQGLRLDPANPRRVVATVVAQSATPIRADTKATLEYQGLTGIASVSLTGGEPDAATARARPGRHAADHRRLPRRRRTCRPRCAASPARRRPCSASSTR